MTHSKFTCIEISSLFNKFLLVFQNSKYLIRYHKKEKKEKELFVPEMNDLLKINYRQQKLFKTIYKPNLLIKSSRAFLCFHKHLKMIQLMIHLSIV